MLVFECRRLEVTSDVPEDPEVAAIVQVRVICSCLCVQVGVLHVRECRAACGTEQD